MAVPLSKRFKSLLLWLVSWVGTCATYWNAAAMYEQLSVLSDAELARRGLSRSTLPQAVRDAAANDR